MFQPESSPIQYVKRKEQIEITIPPAGFSRRLGFLCGFELIWFSVLINTDYVSLGRALADVVSRISLYLLIIAGGILLA